MNTRTLKILKIVVTIFAVVIVILLGLLIFAKPAQGPTAPGEPLISSDGHFALMAPGANAVVKSPISISGIISGGGWFFEAVFPVKVLDGDGTVIGTDQAHPAGAPDSWMSTGTVPFAASVTFSKPKYAAGTILFANDNPSGLPKNAREFRLPVRFQ